MRKSAADAWSPLSTRDDLDRRVLHALQIDGRASFARIGEVLGVSDQTVARRYARLRREGVARVLGLTDPLRLGLTPWLVRVRCTPDAAASVGEALARRPDTRWVSLISGGTEISCMVESRAADQSEVLLLRTLPRTPRVVEVAAHAILHVFYGRDLSPVSRLGPLSPDEAAALVSPDAPGSRAAEPGEPVPLEKGDRRMLDALAVDGRASAAELAAATGWSQTTVRRRMAQLRSAGALYFDLDLDLAQLSPSLRAGLWLEAEPARLAEVGAALTTHDEVAYAAAVTGTANIYASISCQGPGAFYRYLTGPVAALPGLRRTETAPLHRTLKGAGPPFTRLGSRSSAGADSAAGSGT
jgi:DNA-binding Lrp family transcriptional regulator